MSMDWVETVGRLRFVLLSELCEVVDLSNSLTDILKGFLKNGLRSVHPFMRHIWYGVLTV